MSLNIEIEDCTTWPSAFLQQATTNRPLAIAYHHERSRIDRLCQDDIRLRTGPPPNEYNNAYYELVEGLEAILIRNWIVGYHCTRLTRSEIDDIKTNGLQILSLSLVKRRLAQCKADGLLSPEHYEYLRNSRDVELSLGNRHGQRTGMIWFCANRSTLQDALSVHRFFRSWGGEAVYLGHEEDESIAPILARIGTPYIVKCAIHFRQTRHFIRTSRNDFFRSSCLTKLNFLNLQ